jgi:hypothetical protein
MAVNNLLKFFSGSGAQRELRETRRAWDHCQTLWRASPLGNADIFRMALSMVERAVDEFDRVPHMPFWSAASDAVEELLLREYIADLEPRWAAIEDSMELAVEFRETIVHRRRWVVDYPHVSAEFERIVVSALKSLLAEMPANCFRNGSDAPDGGFEVQLLDLLDEPAKTIERLFALPYDEDGLRLGLFGDLRKLCAANMMEGSGFPRTADSRLYANRLVGPVRNTRITDPRELAEVYLRRSPLKPLLELPVPLQIPLKVRFEHCHIIGGTGHGKTQLMQRMIHADLLAAQKDGRSVIVIDSQGDLIDSLIHLACFAPDEPESLADRLVIIDPDDIEFPAALNMFDAHLERTADYRPVDRERVQNGAIELYEYFFEALLGAELTQKQGVVFKYLARLMLTIPQATIHTLMEVMEDGEKFRPYMKALPGSARHFFETEFFHPSFSATKKQIVRRLWGVLATPAFERMFAHPENKVDLFQALNEGKIVLINTSKDLLKQEGSSLFGRFFLAMLMQAALERSTLPEERRVPAFVYVDEAQEYFDETIGTILNQARKYRVGLTLAHQNLDQLGPQLRATVLANTSLKCVGGVSARDARALAPELRTEPEFIEGMRKRGDRTEFAAWIKGVTGPALKLTVPLGTLGRLPRLTEDQIDLLYERNRGKYAAPLALRFFEGGTEEEQGEMPADGAPPEDDPKVEVPARPPLLSSIPEDMPQLASVRSRDPSPSAPPTTPFPQSPRKNEAPISPPLGRGGRKHQYLQHFIKGIAEERGYRAVIEEPILDGAGRVDVALFRGEERIACEISVTTGKDQELANVEKCLAAGFPQVILIAPEERHLRTKQKFIVSQIESEHRDKVLFLLPDMLIEHLDLSANAPAPADEIESVVRGYRVKVKSTAGGIDEAAARRRAVAAVLARSLRQREE